MSNIHIDCFKQTKQFTDWTIFNGKQRQRTGSRLREKDAYIRANIILSMPMCRRI